MKTLIDPRSADLLTKNLSSDDIRVGEAFLQNASRNATLMEALGDDLTRTSKYTYEAGQASNLLHVAANALTSETTVRQAAKLVPQLRKAVADREKREGTTPAQVTGSAREEAEVLLFRHGAVRRWNPVVQAAIFLLEAAGASDGPSMITPFSTTRLTTSVTRDGRETIIDIEARTIQDPRDVKDIKVCVSGENRTLYLHKDVSGCYREPSGFLSNNFVPTPSEAETYRNLLKDVRACYEQAPRTDSVVCADRTGRSTVFPLFWSWPAPGRRGVTSPDR